MALLATVIAAAALLSAELKLPKVDMKYRKLGSSDMLVSSCCLGTMTWGNQNTDEQAAEQLNYAWDRGVNFLDSASREIENDLSVVVHSSRTGVRVPAD